MITVLPWISFGIAAAAFAFGAKRFFKKKKPMYFQLLICAAGCFALRELSDVVTELCGGSERSVTVGLLGLFGCLFFLLSANYGQLDGIVDDHAEGSGRARVIAFAAPVLFGACLLALLIKADLGAFSAIVYAIVLAPLIPASYFNLKHLLLPVDPFGFLRATRECNFTSLAFCLLCVAQLAANAFLPAWCGAVVTLLSAADLFLLVLASERGIRKWGI